MDAANGKLIIWFGIGVGLIVLYIVLMGPILIACVRGYLPFQIFDFVYYPIEVLAKKSEYLSHIANKYIEWWIMITKTPLG